MSDNNILTTKYERNTNYDAGGRARIFIATLETLERPVFDEFHRRLAEVSGEAGQSFLATRDKLNELSREIDQSSFWIRYRLAREADHFPFLVRRGHLTELSREADRSFFSIRDRLAQHALEAEQFSVSLQYVVSILAKSD